MSPDRIRPALVRILLATAVLLFAIASYSAMWAVGWATNEFGFLLLGLSALSAALLVERW